MTEENVPAAPPAPESAPPKTWADLGLGADLLALIAQAGYESPTPVQRESIPFSLEGLDLIVSAQTGTGKTAAFVLPLLEKIRGKEGTQALILAPSREIALQTQAVLTQFGTPIGIRSAALIGGIDIRLDEKALATYPQVLVATPGRLCDHLDRGNVWLEFLKVLILDEADRMLEMGFADQLSRILQETPDTRQSLLFSATLPPQVEKLAHRVMYEPHRIQIGKPVSAAKTVDQDFIFVEDASKMSELMRLLRHEPGTVFVFTRSKEGASRVWRSLRSRGFYDATQMHSDLRQKDREQALEDFKTGKYRVIVATDVIGRGIHVDGVAHVVNYDLPREPSDYVHRIGRTGRADSKGKATSFVTSKDRRILQGIEKLLGRSVRAPERDSVRAPERGSVRAPERNSEGRNPERSERRDERPRRPAPPSEAQTSSPEGHEGSPSQGAESKTDGDPRRKRRRRRRSGRGSGSGSPVPAPV